MAVKQFSVFVENTPGSLARLVKLLGSHGINLISLTTADTAQFGIVRGISNQNEQAVRLLQENGYSVKLTDVLAVTLPDEPGSFAKMLSLLAEEGISVEYMYSTVRSVPGRACIILRVDNTEKSEQILKNSGIQLLDSQEITSL